MGCPLWPQYYQQLAQFQPMQCAVATQAPILSYGMSPYFNQPLPGYAVDQSYQLIPFGWKIAEYPEVTPIIPPNPSNEISIPSNEQSHYETRISNQLV